MRKRSLLAPGCLVLLLLALAACETGKPYGGAGGGRVNFGTGSALGRGLDVRQSEALYPAFVTAMETGIAGRPVSWRGGGASGKVTPGPYFVANLKPDARTALPLAARLAFPAPLETELGLHALTGAANVRAGPSMEAAVLEQLAAGAPVTVVGKTANGPWMLVEAGGAARGYVHQSLMTRAPGAELTLAGGPTRAPHLCRAFEQELSVGGKSDRWPGVACDRGKGWRVEPASRRVM